MIFSAFKIIVDRNIFDPDRRPMVASGPAPTIVDSFSLVGTMSYQKGIFAVFDGTSSEYRKVLQPGGGIAGYTVKVIGGTPQRSRPPRTNELELSVGMQMRRNEDGRWSVGEQEESAGGSYASISRGRGRDGGPAIQIRRSGGNHRPGPGPGAPDAGPPPPPGPRAATPTTRCAHDGASASGNRRKRRRNPEWERQLT